MRIIFVERHNDTAREEAAELGLLWGTADLGNDWRWNQGNYAKLQTDLMLGPCPPLVSICGHQYRRIVYKVTHAGRRTLEGGRLS